MSIFWLQTNIKTDEFFFTFFALAKSNQNSQIFHSYDIEFAQLWDSQNKDENIIQSWIASKADGKAEKTVQFKNEFGGGKKKNILIWLAFSFVCVFL